MKKSISAALLLLLCLFVSHSSAQTATNLAFFGTTTSPFEVDTESGFTTTGFSQTADALTLTAPFTGATTLFGAFGSLASPASFDWSGEQELALSLSSPIAPPVILFVEFYASDLVSALASAEVDASAALTTPSSIPLVFTSGDIASLADVGGIFFTWGDSSSSNDNDLTIHSIQAVPEPSTWALLLFGAALFGGLAWRRHRLAAARR